MPTTNDEFLFYTKYDWRLPQPAAELVGKTGGGLSWWASECANQLPTKPGRVMYRSSPLIWGLAAPAPFRCGWLVFLQPHSPFLMTLLFSNLPSQAVWGKKHRVGGIARENCREHGKKMKNPGFGTDPSGLILVPPLGLSDLGQAASLVWAVIWEKQKKFYLHQETVWYLVSSKCSAKVISSYAKGKKWKCLA